MLKNVKVHYLCARREGVGRTVGMVPLILNLETR